MLTGNPKPETIHDFGGFPGCALRDPLSGAGCTGRRGRSRGALKAAGITAGVDGCRGLDHGAWVPLMHMFPGADVPVVELSVQPARGAAHHIALGRALAPLAQRGVLIVGSGHATHNLRDWMAQMRRPGQLPYVAEFADWLAERLDANDDAALIAWKEQGPEALRAHPTDEHFLPLLVAYGAAGEQRRASSACIAASRRRAGDGRLPVRAGVRCSLRDRSDTECAGSRELVA